MNKYYILVSGRAGTGKTCSSNFIKSYLNSIGESCQIIPFAWGVKRTATEAGWDGNKDQKGRRFLIDIGKAGRTYDINLWADQAAQTVLTAYPDYDVIISDDWRYPNEGNYIKNTLKGYRVIKLRIESPKRESLRGTPEYNDESETSLPEGFNDFYNCSIHNASTLEEFQIQCNEFVDHFIK